MAKRQILDLLGKFDGVKIEVNGEILSVSLPVVVCQAYSTPNELMGSDLYRSIENLAALVGTDEVHISSGDNDNLCAIEVGLHGAEDISTTPWVIYWNGIATATAS